MNPSPGAELSQAEPSLERKFEPGLPRGPGPARLRRTIFPSAGGRPKARPAEARSSRNTPPENRRIRLNPETSAGGFLHGAQRFGRVVVEAGFRDELAGRALALVDFLEDLAGASDDASISHDSLILSGRF